MKEVIAETFMHIGTKRPCVKLKLEVGSIGFTKLSPALPSNLKAIVGDWHINGFYTLCWISVGDGFVENDMGGYVLSNKMMNFIPPMSLHKVSKNGSMYGWILYFNDDAIDIINDGLRMWIKNDLFRNYSVLTFMESELPEILRASVEEIDRELHDENVGSEKINEYLIYLLSTILTFCLNHKQYIGQSHSYQSVLSPLQCRSYDVYDAFKRCVDDNFQNVRRVSDYIDMLGISRRELSDSIKQITGKGPLSLIHDRLLFEAKLRLRNACIPIKQISHELGFFDESHFCKFFKKEIGMTAIEYRRISTQSVL